METRESQESVSTNVNFTSGLLAGTVILSSSSRGSGASVMFENPRLTTTADDMVGLWFSNIIAAAEINTASGILLIANPSQITKAVD